MERDREFITGFVSAYSTSISPADSSPMVSRSGLDTLWPGQPANHGDATSSTRCCAAESWTVSLELAERSPAR